MAYADRDVTGSRVIAMFIVAIIVAGVGYAFVTGLAVDFAKKVNKQLNVFDVAPPPPPPPPEPPPPPPPDQHLQPPPVVSPPPIVQTPSPPVQINTVPTPPPVYIPTPTAPPPSPPAPAPAPPRISQAAQSKGTPSSWYSDDDYPPAAQRANAEGRVTARLTIGTDGHVTGCDVTAGSGNSDLDSTTCRIALRRGRYSPAKDDSGRPIAATSTIAIRWVLPKE